MTIFKLVCGPAAFAEDRQLLPRTGSFSEQLVHGTVSIFFLTVNTVKDTIEFEKDQFFMLLCIYDVPEYFLS